MTDLPNLMAWCSVAALYLVERLKSEVMAAAATHFQALAVGQARRRTIKRLARHPPGHRKALHVRISPAISWRPVLQLAMGETSPEGSGQ